MKKIFLSALFASVVLAGCSDAYEIQQAGVVTEESQVFKSADDVGKGIRYVYSQFSGETEIDFDSYFTDELGVGAANAGQGINDGSYTFILQAGNDNVQGIWGSYYGAVNRLNRILSRIDEMLVEPNAEVDKLNEHKAHIYALRAYCHYKLFAFFTPDYTNPNGLSVIKFDFLQTSDYSRYEKRSTVGEIVAFIESDIEKAKKLGGIKNEGGTGFASNEMLEAILIKMYSMLQTDSSYAKLEVAFNELSKTKSIADYGMYAGMFGDGAGTADSEGIFKLNRVSTQGSGTSGVAASWYAAEVGEGAYMEMGRSLYNELDKLDPSKQGTAYSSDRLDLRYAVAVFSNSLVATNYASLSPEDYRTKDILHIGKYPGITNRPLMNSLWMFRYTDMLLSLAEKRAHEGKVTGTVALNDYSNVESIIYNIRANRHLGANTPVTMPTNFSSKQQAFLRILEERRVEFAFEGQRYLDMKRIGVRAGSPGFVRDPKDCASTNACSLEPSSLKLTLPIPRSEMVSNPNMVQNPGY
ncbi:RagB/SusD family nutrient uptake outer membrane protein [Flavobacterium sp. xlx-214]|uniref:RagB/SusD family nutrient uptake outer membrane protein n=1 Tax=unclassified Flavobacterium TaxID=196869 RepID=UPI0013D406FE|nr:MULTISPECIES: RagB/SusD family nutrient uptake outer membrane protein [unclassified Flavobacterium]MBA5793408.1 RagB/SusD family nutrient uptake outer membrane protein [Flavobacterium sp. xlx-221]QMI84032.1 RagB/SusD family nutrient uptake outer membrane protein [Flavobacterium sp. xlx-214]